MGFNTSVVILNDSLGDIANNPERFVRELLDAIRGFGYAKHPYVTGDTKVVSVEHADHKRIIAVGGNCGDILGAANGVRNDGSDESRLEMIRQVASDFGYDLHKKRSRRLKEQKVRVPLSQCVNVSVVLTRQAKICDHCGADIPRKSRCAKRASKKLVFCMPCAHAALKE